MAATTATRRRVYETVLDDAASSSDDSDSVPKASRKKRRPNSSESSKEAWRIVEVFEPGRPDVEDEVTALLQQLGGQRPLQNGQSYGDLVVTQYKKCGEHVRFRCKYQVRVKRSIDTGTISIEERGNYVHEVDYTQRGLKKCVRDQIDQQVRPARVRTEEHPNVQALHFTGNSFFVK